MPYRKQIITITVLGILAFILGYWINLPEESTVERAEAGEPIAPTIVTNVITNTVNNTVTNIITNTVPIQPKPNPVKPKPLTSGQLTLSEKDIVGTYERKFSIATYKRVYLENGVRESYANGKKVEEHKWSIVNGEIHIIIDSRYIQVYRVNNDKRITWIAEINDAKRKDTLNTYQYTYKKIK